MEHAIEHLQHELAGVRTGRANPGLIENISVDANGEHMPVKACGTVTVRNPQLLAITLYDAGVSE
jgi:ribosome recycling factor